MDTVSQLNLYVQRVCRCDAMYVCKRDGNTEPPTYIGSLSAPGLTTVSLYSGTGLPSKALVRKALASAFIQVNHIDLNPAAHSPVAGSSTGFTNAYRTLILHLLSKNVRTAELRQRVEEIFPITPDRLTYELFQLLQEDKVVMTLSEDRLLWQRTSVDESFLTVEESQGLLSLMQALATAAVPYALQWRARVAPYPALFITSSQVDLAWADVPGFKAPDGGKLGHAIASLPGGCIHRFTYSFGDEPVAGRALYVRIDVDASSFDARSKLHDELQNLYQVCRTTIVLQAKRDEERRKNLSSFMEMN